MRERSYSTDKNQFKRGNNHGYRLQEKSNERANRKLIQDNDTVYLNLFI